MYSKHTWLPRLGTGLNKFANSGDAEHLVLTPEPDTLTQEGTPFSATWMNELEGGVYKAHQHLGAVIEEATAGEALTAGDVIGVCSGTAYKPSDELRAAGSAVSPNTNARRYFFAPANSNNGLMLNDNKGYTRYRITNGQLQVGATYAFDAYYYFYYACRLSSDVVLTLRGGNSDYARFATFRGFTTGDISTSLTTQVTYWSNFSGVSSVNNKKFCLDEYSPDNFGNLRAALAYINSSGKICLYRLKIPTSGTDAYTVLPDTSVDVLTFSNAADLCLDRSPSGRELCMIDNAGGDIKLRVLGSNFVLEFDADITGWNAQRVRARWISDDAILVVYADSGSSNALTAKVVVLNGSTVTSRYSLQIGEALGTISSELVMPSLYRLQPGVFLLTYTNSSGYTSYCVMTASDTGATVGTLRHLSSVISVADGAGSGVFGSRVLLQTSNTSVAPYDLALPEAVAANTTTFGGAVTAVYDGNVYSSDFSKGSDIASAGVKAHAYADGCLSVMGWWKNT